VTVTSIATTIFTCYPYYRTPFELFWNSHTFY